MYWLLLSYIPADFLKFYFRFYSLTEKIFMAKNEAKNFMTENEAQHCIYLTD